MLIISRHSIVLVFALAVALTLNAAHAQKTVAAQPEAQTSKSNAKSTSPRNPEWAAPVDESSNLFRITPEFYRSAQLSKKDVALIQSLGIKTVVSLRSFHSDRKVLEGSGVNMKRIRINTWSINDANVIASLRAIQDAKKEGPVLLHCLHGADRTGTISAMYRIAVQGWSKEQALDELVKGGYGYHSVWKNIPTYIKEVDVAKIRKALDLSDLAATATVAKPVSPQ
jgi:protein tyrosine/serine phosphatase